MKKLFNLAIVALLTVAVISCQKQQTLSVEQAKQQAEQLNGQTVTIEGVLKDICPCPKTEGKVAFLIDTNTPQEVVAQCCNAKQDTTPTECDKSQDNKEQTTTQQTCCPKNCHCPFAICVVGK